MVISKPMLPPKKGYVEVEIDGQRVYKQLETGEDVSEYKRALNILLTGEEDAGNDAI